MAGLVLGVLLCLSGRVHGQAMGVHREMWTNLTGSLGPSLNALTNQVYNPDWPANPAAGFTQVLTNFETEVNSGRTNYGQRVRAYLVPPTNGNYVFWVAADDRAQISLGGDETPASAVRIAWVTNDVTPRTWSSQTNQQSAAIALESGRRYYLEGLMHQHGGGDSFAVRWQLPSGAFETPLAATGSVGTLLIPCNGVASSPGILLQPVAATIPEGANASFKVIVTNGSPMQYRWRRNGTNVSGATRSALVLSNVPPALNGSSYACVISNAAGTVTSAVALLTVLADTNRPVVTDVFNASPTNVLVFFSEPLDAATATNTANYVFSNGVAVTRAAYSAGATNVVLTTSPLANGTNYWIVLNNLRDLAFSSNAIATNTLAGFTALPYVVQDVGGPAFTSVVAAVSNGLNIAVSGQGVGGTNDQFGFGWQLRSGDFDVRLRLAGLTVADPWTKAGLMARETLDANSRFAATFATPAMNGDFFEWRDPAGSAGRMSGFVPANYPNSWLRLKRAGATFSGYASYDGAGWMSLGSVALVTTGQLYVGVAVGGKATNRTATALFRDIAEMTGTVAVVSNPSPRDLIGPTSRKTPIVFSELLYKPAPRADSNNVEFIEIYNSNPWFHEIGGYRIVGGDMSYTFPTGTVIAGGEYLAIAASPASLAAVHGLTNALGPYAGSFKKSDTVKLLDEAGGELLIMSYDGEPPWLLAADGAGHSLILANPTYGESDPRTWDISSQTGGSPGAMNPYTADPLDGVVVNEFLAHTDPPLQDYVELYNHGNTARDLSGAWLSNSPTTNKYRIPDGTIIPARGFVVFLDSQLGFRLDTTGDQIFLVNSNRTRVVDAVGFEGQENPVSSGRVPDGAREIYRLAARTPGTNNGAIRTPPVVINEIMYKPMSDQDDDQYVELHNRSGAPVDLSGWRFTSGIDFTFPTNTSLAAGGYVVVAKNAPRLRAAHPNLNFANCFGDFGGRLAGNGERLALSFPDSTINTNDGVAVTNHFSIPVTEVTYGVGGRWGLWSDGGGSSLELTDPNADLRLAANWADSDETLKSAWSNVEVTGVLDHGSNYGSGITNAQIGILDVGECLVDDLVILAGTNEQNLVANPGFEGGLTNWYLEGSHIRSSLENSGHGGSSRSLHIRTSSRLWTGANSCEFNLVTNQMAAGQTATMRYKARWLRGWPEVYLRLCGNWLEATARLPVPDNLGTPGLQNSRFVTNAAPAIHAVSHWPTVPGASQAVVVTASVRDAGAVTNFVLNYRIDPSATTSTVVMKDDGTGGDAIQGDGVFSGTIPGQASNKIVAFTLSAADAGGATSRFPEWRNINEPDRECVVLFGDGNPSGSFGVYHLWMTQATINRWSSIPDLSNESHDCTMVNGNRVIYNMQGRFAGSPYHQSFNTPNGALCHYKWTFPLDDRFLGATSFNKIHQPGNGAGDDASIQREQTAHTFMRALGVPWLNRRYVAVFVNGNRRGTLMEDAQTPDSDVVEQRWPDDADGWLYKMQPWFEFPPAFTNSASAANKSWVTLNSYTTTGGEKKKARYRWDYMVRSTPSSANDYTNVFALVDAAYAPSNALAASMKNIADMENWMRVFAANHAAGNWDSFGAQNAQNLYGYIGARGTKYSLLMWDYNIVIGAASGPWAPGSNLFTYNGGDPNLDRIYRNPEFRRMYWRALLELASGPLDPSRFAPLVDAKYAAFVANGLNVESPSLNSANGIKIWLSTAQTSIAAQVAAVNATNFTVSPSVAFSNNIALISGSAPFHVKTVWFNGVEWPITWTSITGWTAQVVVQPGTSSFSVAGVDLHGLALTNSTGQVSVVYGGAPVSPQGRVVFHEIMYATNAPGGQYVELLNTASGAAFDLSGWHVNGTGYTFPPGSWIGPNALLTLVADNRSFVTIHGVSKLPAGEFDGTLDPAGETLSLLMADAQTTVVDRVRYEAVEPWPVITNGASLQLIDPTNDNSRVSAWGAGGPAPAPQWTYFAATGYILNVNSNFLIYSGGAGDIYIDDLRFVAGTSNDAGASVLANGDFESGLAGWTATSNFAGSAIATNVRRSGSACLHVVASAGGGGAANAISQVLSPPFTSFMQIVVSYWYLPTTNIASLITKPNNTVVGSFSLNPGTLLVDTAPATPNATNSIWSRLPAYPSLWLNEVQPSNTTVLADNAGEREPWVELVHTGTNTLNLSGLWLSDTYTNLLKWPFPANATLRSNGVLVVWCDAQTNQTATNALHANFRLPPGSGRVALSRIAGGVPRVVDYLTYTNVPVNWSYGDIPDAQPFYRTLMYLATPGATNNGAVPAATVAINEWMADNAQYPDPADDDFEDWIELHNFGDAAVDLGGFFLTDEPGDPDKWTFPTNTLIAPHGFLVVWADDEAGQNNVTGLHAAFKLSKDGEQIGLYSPSRVPLDTVAFSTQQTDVAQGRWPDAAAGVYTLAVPTPGSNNIVSLLNSPPSFVNAASWALEEMAPFAFDAVVSDYDAPLQSITLKLSGAPAGATLDTNTGHFAWTPGESDGPGTNVFLITATDNGWPALGATQQVTLVVQEVNRAPQAGPGYGLDTFAGSLSTVGYAPATDPDLPANELAYALDPGAPAGAVLDPVARTITWTPSDAEAGALVTLGLLITDNGVPPMSATGFVAFNVAPPGLDFRAGLVSATQMQWNAVSGATYRVEYADDIAGPPWQLLTNTTAPAHEMILIELPVPTNDRRFFRLQRSP